MICVRVLFVLTFPMRLIRRQTGGRSPGFYIYKQIDVEQVVWQCGCGRALHVETASAYVRGEVYKSFGRMHFMVHIFLLCLCCVCAVCDLGVYSKQNQKRD